MSTRRITDGILRWQAIASRDIEYHRRQFESPYRSTVHFSQFVRAFLRGVRGKALDAGCGAGANIFHLSKDLPGYRWTGVDAAGEILFAIGREWFGKRNLDVRLVAGDFYDLTRVLPSERFDLVLSMQTLQVLPWYEKALEQLLAVTRGWLFISGLFTDFDVDVVVSPIDYTWPAGVQSAYHYNVYSLRRFREYCEARGAQQFESQDFEIDIDLQRSPGRGLSTYTVSSAQGQRMQFSGPIFLPWKFIAVRMGNA